MVSIVVLFVAFKLIKGAKPKVEVIDNTVASPSGESEEDKPYTQSIPDITKNPLTGRKYTFL